MNLIRYNMMYNKNSSFSSAEALFYIIVLSILFIIIAPIAMSTGNQLFGYTYGRYIGLIFLLSLPLILVYYKQYNANNKDKIKNY